MALKKCKECGNKVRTIADFCPHCGAKQKSKGLGGFAAVLFLILMFFVASQFDQYTKKAKEEIAKQTEVSNKQREEREKEAKRIREKQEIEKTAFEANIENHYANLVKFEEQGQLDNALTEIDLFLKFGKYDPKEGKYTYKDVNNYYKIVKTKSLSAQVKKVPASDFKENLRLYIALLALNPTEQLYKNKIKHYEAIYDQHLIEKKKAERNSSQLGYTIEKAAQIYGAVEGRMDIVDALVKFVKAHGNRCDSVSAASDNVFSKGYTLKCNKYYYTYQILDKGGKWLLQVDD